MDRLLLQQLLEEGPATAEARLAQLFRRAHRRGGILGVDDQERPVLGAEEPRGVERLERADLARPLDCLADRDERRHIRVLRAQRLRNHRADVRHRHRLRRDVAGVPVVLMPRVEDEAKVRGVERPDDRAAVDDAGNLLEALRELDVVHGGGDGGKRAEHFLAGHARLERRVVLRVECLGLRHAAGHPQHDDGIGGGARRLRGLQQLRLATDECRQRRAGRRAHEAAAAHPGKHLPLLARQSVEGRDAGRRAFSIHLGTPDRCRSARSGH